jgi:hypothetical protein
MTTKEPDMFTVYAYDRNVAALRQIRPETAAGIRQLHERLGIENSIAPKVRCYSARQMGTGNRPKTGWK